MRRVPFYRLRPFAGYFSATLTTKRLLELFTCAAWKTTQNRHLYEIITTGDAGVSINQFSVLEASVGEAERKMFEWFHDLPRRAYA